MRVVVKHFADPDETVTAIPGKVTVEAQADDGMAIVGDEPVDLTLGQQANIELTERGGQIAVQAVLDPAPPVEAALTKMVPADEALVERLTAAALTAAHGRYGSLLSETESFRDAIRAALAEGQS